MVFSILKKQIHEIQSDRALRFYGACLAITQVLTAFYWIVSRKAQVKISSSNAICWPFFENCFDFRFLTVEAATILIVLFGATAAIGFFLFLSKRTTPWAYYGFLFVLLFKILIYIQDYRLRMNQHYMLIVTSLVFLFLPYKRRMLQVTLVLFYVWAATLKFNMEWLSGQVLHANPLWISDTWLPAACAYVVVLELLLVWGILSAKKWLFWATFVQLILFHIVSWPVVNYYYPLLMFLLLMIFPLSFLIPKKGEPPSLLKSLFYFNERLAVYLWIGLFSFFQLIPVAIPGDEKITGEGRLYALHMIDARVDCRGAIKLKYGGGRTKSFPIPLKTQGRIRCDPAVYFSRAKQLYARFKGKDGFLDLDLYMESRRSNQREYRTVLDIRDFGNKDLTYNTFWSNDWIIK